MADDDELRALVAETLQRLADAMDDLPADRADDPTLCDGWTVRNVLAHMTMAARYSPEEFTAELRRDDFDFTRLSDRIARRDGALPFGALVEDLRGATMANWAPPGGGFAGALNHAVIHGLDVTVPLGLPRTSSDQAIRQVLDGLTAGRVHQRFGTGIAGGLRATDLDWSYGSGASVQAPAQDIALRLCGRRI